MAEQTPLMMVSGTDDYLRRRFLQKTRRHYEGRGWRVVDTTGEDHAFLRSLLASTGLLFEEQTLVVIHKPEKLPLDLVTAHSQERDPSVVFLLVYEAEAPDGPVSKLVPAAGTGKPMNLPAFFKLKEYAVGFLKEEARAGGFPIPAELAEELVGRLGTDLGFLSFEVSKACALARARGHTGLMTAGIVRDSMASLAESDGSAIMDALGSRNLRALTVELHRYQTSKGGDPTIELCGRVLSPTILKWIQATHMHESGVSPEAAAGRMSANPWVWRTKILGPARAWGLQGCRNLLLQVAKAQTAVFTGKVQPWVVLESGLLLACSG